MHKKQEQMTQYIKAYMDEIVEANRQAQKNYLLLRNGMVSRAISTAGMILPILVMIGNNNMHLYSKICLKNNLHNDEVHLSFPNKKGNQSSVVGVHRSINRR